MAVTTITSTCSLDIESVRELEELARHSASDQRVSVASGRTLDVGFSSQEKAISRQPHGPHFELDVERHG